MIETFSVKKNVNVSYTVQLMNGKEETLTTQQLVSKIVDAQAKVEELQAFITKASALVLEETPQPAPEPEKKKLRLIFAHIPPIVRKPVVNPTYPLKKLNAKHEEAMKKLYDLIFEDSGIDSTTLRIRSGLKEWMFYALINVLEKKGAIHREQRAGKTFFYRNKLLLSNIESKEPSLPSVETAPQNESLDALRAAELKNREAARD